MSMLLQVGVKIFLRNREGKYLLLKRSPLRYPDMQNPWDIPGGRIVLGTSLFENIKREVLEETKLTVLGGPKLIGARDIIRLSEKHIVRLTFLSSIDGEPVLDEEHVDFKWVTPEEMKDEKELDEFTQHLECPALRLPVRTRRQAQGSDLPCHRV